MKSLDMAKNGQIVEIEAKPCLVIPWEMLQKRIAERLPKDKVEYSDNVVNVDFKAKKRIV